MNGYWGPNITGQLLASQRWAPPGAFIEGAGGIILDQMLRAARRKLRKQGAALDDELEAEMAVHGGPLIGEKRGGRSIFEAMASPEFKYGRSLGKAVELNPTLGVGLDLLDYREKLRQRTTDNSWRMPVEQLKSATDIEEAQIRAKALLDAAVARGESAETVAGIRAASGANVAGINAESRRTAAELRAAEGKYRTDRTVENRLALQEALLAHQKAITERKELGATERKLIGEEGALNRVTMQGTSALSLEQLRQSGQERSWDQRHRQNLEAIRARGDEMEDIIRLRSELEDQGVMDILQQRRMPAPTTGGIGQAPSVGGLQFQDAQPTELPPNFGTATPTEELQADIKALIRHGKLDEAATLSGILKNMSAQETTNREREALGHYWRLRNEGAPHARAYSTVLDRYPDLPAEAANRIRLHGQGGRDPLMQIRSAQQIALSDVGAPDDITKSSPSRMKQWADKLRARTREILKDHPDRTLLDYYEKHQTEIEMPVGENAEPPASPAATPPPPSQRAGEPEENPIIWQGNGITVRQRKTK